jgi:hypothetical protein
MVAEEVALHTGQSIMRDQKIELFIATASIRECLLPIRYDIGYKIPALRKAFFKTKVFRRYKRCQNIVEDS